MADLHGTGVRVALFLVEVEQAPLSAAGRRRHAWCGVIGTSLFRRRSQEVVTPDVALAPLVGWDRAGYRLGYGGGFDRTLAHLARRAPSLSA